MTLDDATIFVSALLAGASFVAVAWPVMARLQKRERYQDMILRRKRDLFAKSRLEEQSKKRAAPEDISAKDTLAALFKVRKLAGSVADDIRARLVQAGYRSPSAPLVFLVCRLGLPVLFVLLGMMFLSGVEKDLPSSMEFLILLLAAGCGYGLPGLLVKNQMLKRQADVAISFPDALDMMLVCVQGGISIEQAINRIAEEISGHAPVLAEELGVLGAELGLLNDRRSAFQGFAVRVGSGGAKSFATTLIQAEQYGTSISTALRVMADELRDMRMAEAERKAASLPPKLTVPMIVFFLPALFVVILGPAGIQAAIAASSH